MARVSAVANAKIEATDRVSGFRTVKRHQRDKKIIHIELYRERGWFLSMVLCIPCFARKILFSACPAAISIFFLPIAKCGIRDFTTKATSSLLKVVDDMFPNPMRENVIPHLLSSGEEVAFMVYMFVQSQFRKRGLGEVLLGELMAECRALGATIMLLVHDDNGTGRLLKYYTERGFKSCPSLVEKGLLIRL